MLEYTYSVEEKEWEIVDGNVVYIDANREILRETDLERCGHYVRWSKLD